MPRWVMHSTNSRTRATQCVILNKDLPLLLMGKKTKMRNVSVLIKHFGIPQPGTSQLAQKDSRKSDPITEHHISSALYMQVCTILIHPEGTASFQASEDMAPAFAGGSEASHNTALGSHLLNSVQQLEKLPPSTYLSGQVTVAAF